MTSENPKPAKILFVHSSDEMYGSDRVLLQLVRRLDKSRFTPIVILPNDIEQQETLSEAIAAAGIETSKSKLAVLRSGYLNPIGLTLFLARLLVSTIQVARLIRRESVDLVHSNTSAVISGASAAWLAGRPHVWQTLEIIVKPRVLWRTMALLVPRFSERVVTASGPTCEHLCAGNPRAREKAEVIHYGIDPARIDTGRGHGERLREEWGIDHDAPLVGVVARISSWKGQDYFLRVAALVAKSHPATRFAVVGGTVGGKERLAEELEALARELGIADSVTFAGFRTDIPVVMDALDIVVMPSTLPDPFPTVVLEAMGACKPVVANAHGGCIEAIVEGTTGLLVEPGDAGGMAAAITSLIDEPEEAARLGRNGRERILSELTPESFVQKWTDLYDRVLDAAAARSR